MQDNELVGFDVEFARRFAAHIRSGFADREFGGLIAALVSGKIERSSPTCSSRRKTRQIDFSDPYFEQIPWRSPSSRTQVASDRRRGRAKPKVVRGRVAGELPATSSTRALSPAAQDDGAHFGARDVFGTRSARSSATCAWRPGRCLAYRPGCTSRCCAGSRSSSC